MLFTYMTCGRDSYPSSSNPGNESIATGVKYNIDQGLNVKSFNKLITSKGVFIQGGGISLSSDFNGGSFLKGSPPTRARNVTVASMVVDRTPVTNIMWIEMIDWLKKNAPEDFYKKLLPDETVWSREFAYNDPIIKQYFTHPTFWFHPIVGISWVQAIFYCWWRTFRTNLNIIGNMKDYDTYSDFGGYTLAEIANCDLAEIADHNIAKFAELKLSEVAPKLPEIEEGEEEEFEEEEGYETEEEEEEFEEEEEGIETEPGKAGNLEELKYQGLLLCNKLRLPTGAEYAYYIGGSVNRRIKGGAVANGAIPDQVDPYYETEQAKDYYNGTQKDTSTAGIATSREGIIVKDQKPNPWNGVRARDERGRIAANFKQGPGEYSDGGLTSYVYKYPPNNYGIFCFVGISELLQGVYRDIPPEELDDLNPIRRGGSRDKSSDYRNFNPLITDKTRTYIGPNYQDTISIGKYRRRPIKETAKTSFTGFRCVQTVINDRASSPY